MLPVLGVENKSMPGFTTVQVGSGSQTPLAQKKLAHASGGAHSAPGACTIAVVVEPDAQPFTVTVYVPANKLAK